MPTKPKRQSTSRPCDLTTISPDSSRGVDVIKIDTEGAEAMILQGMENILRKNKTLRLVIEYSPKLLETSGHDPEEVLNKLTGLGFRIQFLDEAEGALVDLPPDSTSRLTGTIEGRIYFREPLPSTAGGKSVSRLQAASRRSTISSEQSVQFCRPPETCSCGGRSARRPTRSGGC